MTLKTRRFVLCALVLVFLFAGTGLVLYAQGWRLNFETFAPTRVGGIYIRSFPAEANIFLDGEEVENKSGLIQSGTLVNNLFPRSYRLSLTASGFKSLERNVSVQPSLVTEADTLVLVPEAATVAATSTAEWFSEKSANATSTEKITIPEDISGKTVKMKRASRTTVGFAQNDGEFYLYRPADGALTHLASDVRDFFFSTDADKVAVLGSKGLEIFSLNGKNYWRFNLAEASKISGLVWYKDGEHIFVEYPGKTSFLDLSDAGLQGFTEVAPTNDVRYDALENVLYYLEDSEILALRFPG